MWPAPWRPRRPPWHNRADGRHLRAARTWVPACVPGRTNAQPPPLCTLALSAATQEAVYLRKLANELGFTQTSPTILYEDCTAAVALSKENRFRNRSKHISLRWSYVSERQSPDIGDIEVISVSRTIMLADIFASPRPAASFIPFRDVLLVRTPRVTRLSQGDASTLADDDA